MKDFIQSILNNVNKIIIYNYSNYELFLNITFLIIVFIICYIIYYYYINRTAFLNSTCKTTININNNDDYYYLYVKDNLDNNLYNIKYNLKSKTPIAECACNPGNVTNKFKNIKLYDKNNTNCKNKTDNSLVCNCDNDYTTTDSPLLYSGESFLVNYMNIENDGISNNKEECLLTEPKFPDELI